MDQPLVCCICLTIPGREEFLKRAIGCFNSQTYPNKKFCLYGQAGIIGTKRNHIIGQYPEAEIIAHWDDDDWSCPTRLAEQVAFMQSTGSPVVGYRDMPFYDVTLDRVTFYDSHRPTGYVLGTSLMYRREVWEKTPFPDSNDEDGQWQRTLGVEMIKSQSSVAPVRDRPCPSAPYPCACSGHCYSPGTPRMVATIHPGNTSPKKGARFEKASAELDAQVRACISAPIAVR